MNKAAIFLIFFFVFFKKTTVVESLIEKQHTYLDEDFKSFTYFFASSPSADFLSRIVHTHEPKFVQLKIGTGLMSKTIDKAFAINQVSNDIMRVFISILLLALLPFFLYIGIFGRTKNQLTLTLSSIAAYFSVLVAFFLTNGIFNIGFVCSIPLVFGLFVFYLCNYDCTTRSLYTYARYIFCFTLAKLLYDIGTCMQGGDINNLDYGLSGFLYMTLLKGNSYFVLKVVHFLILSLMALIIFKSCPKYFSPNALQSPLSVKMDRFILSFLCALPAAASFTQIYFLIANSLNPIDPSIFFMIPSSINFKSFNTIVSLTSWFVTTYAFFVLSTLVEKDYGHVLNKIPNKIVGLL